VKKIFVFFFGFILTGCLQTRSDVKAGEQGRVLQQQVSSLQKNTADVGSRFADLEEQIRFLNGRVEVLESKLMNSNQDAEQAKKMGMESLQSQNQKLMAFQEALTKMEQDNSQLHAEVAALKSALSQSSDSQKSLTATSTKNPFEIAEELFAKKEHRQAILEYQKYREKYPRGKSFTAATYKMGLSFQELGLKDEARAFYEEVILKSPKSDEARKAKVRLQKLK